MRRGFLIFTTLFICSSSIHAQNDRVKDILNIALYDTRVYDKVFFEYEGIGNFTSVLPRGTYVFIWPDSNLQLAYPDIKYRLATTWGSERKLNTMTYIKNDSSTVFVADNMDGNVKYYLVFNEIQI